MNTYFKYTEEQLNDKDFILGLYNNIPNKLKGISAIIEEMEEMEKKLPDNIFNDKEIIKVMMKAITAVGGIFGKEGGASWNIAYPIRVIESPKFDQKHLYDKEIFEIFFECSETEIEFKLIPDEMKKERFIRERYAQTKYARNLNLSYETEKDLIIIACKHNKDFFEKLSERERKDEDIIIANLSSNPESFEHLGMTQRMNEKYVFAALKANWETAQFITPIKFKNKEFLKKIVKLDSRVLNYIPKIYRDQELLDIALTSDVVDVYMIYTSVPDELKNNKELCIKLLEKDYSNYQILSDKMKLDKELIDMACGKNAWNIKHVPDEIKETKEFLYQYKESIELNFYLKFEQQLLKAYERDDKLNADLGLTKPEDVKTLTKPKI